uniref:Putative salivary kunitz domain protein n=1 Tax=Ixodes ricinus TaxID=34613 RepID=A0A0K8RBY8_IXORI
MSFCTKFERRWGYNYKNKRCEMFQGCEDSGNSFPNAKECWNTCAKKFNHLCTQEPDYITTIGWRNRYYYNINTHKCESAYMLRGLVTGKSNLFNDEKECKAACMSIYEPDPDDWEWP